MLARTGSAVGELCNLQPRDVFPSTIRTSLKRTVLRGSNEPETVSRLLESGRRVRETYPVLKRASRIRSHFPPGNQTCRIPIESVVTGHWFDRTHRRSTPERLATDLIRGQSEPLFSEELATHYTDDMFDSRYKGIISLYRTCKQPGVLHTLFCGRERRESSPWPRSKSAYRATGEH